MKISLILCTYMRPEAICTCLDSLKQQSRLPDEILIIDGSLNHDSQKAIESKSYELPLKYFYVDPEHRGLTRQRNYGVMKVSQDIDVIAFMDDDVVVAPLYFEEIEKTYETEKDIIGAGGVTTNEVQWERSDRDVNELGYYKIDGWKRREDIRFRLRKKLGLVSLNAPGRTDGFGHERHLGFIPPTGKTYEVENLIGMNMSYKKKVFDKLSFSMFYEGYGLYEDKDFSLQASKLGRIYINTKANLEHHHDPLGRPNYVKYGEMVVWNGWRVWRVGVPNPSFINKVKWWSITILLTYIRFANFLVGQDRKKSWDDFIGRNKSILRLLYSKPDMSDV